MKEFEERERDRGRVINKRAKKGRRILRRRLREREGGFLEKIESHQKRIKGYRETCLEKKRIPTQGDQVAATVETIRE
eukprot:12421670-Karenia_brevis.AAC.1